MGSGSDRTKLPVALIRLDCLDILFCAQADVARDWILQKKASEHLGRCKD
jgi:hypothetical protein